MSAPLSPRPRTEPHNSGISPSAKRTFESNLGRIFVRQPGESEKRFLAIAILSSILVLPVVLTAILDLGRKIGFIIGNHHASAAKYFDGKSWSLIDQTSGACKTAAGKIQAMLATDPNRQSEKTIRKEVANLIQGYRENDGSNTLFGGANLQKGTRQIDKAQKALVKAVTDYASRNGEKWGFNESLERAKLFVQETIKQAAGNDLHVGYGIKKLPLKSRAVEAYKEFLDVLHPEAAGSAVRSAKDNISALQNLQALVSQGTLSAAQARDAIQKEVDTVYTRGLQTSFAAADQAVHAVLAEACKQELLTVEEANAIVPQATVAELAKAAARQVAEHSDISNDFVTVPQFNKIAERLIREKKLAPKSRSVFVAKAKAHLPTAYAALEKVREQQARAMQEQTLRQAQAEEMSIAQAKKTAVQEMALNHALGDLNGISLKQHELEALLQQHALLKQERQLITNEKDRLQKTEVVMVHEGKHTSMNLLDASRFFHTEEVKIAQKNKNDAEIERLLNELTNEDTNTVQLIDQLSKASVSLRAKVSEMTGVSAKIQQLHQELASLNHEYKASAKLAKEQLAPAARNEVAKLEAVVSAMQDRLDKGYENVLALGPIDKLKAAVAKPPKAAPKQPEVVEEIQPVEKIVPIAKPGRLDALRALWSA